MEQFDFVVSLSADVNAMSNIYEVSAIDAINRQIEKLSPKNIEDIIEKLDNISGNPDYKVEKIASLLWGTALANVVDMRDNLSGIIETCELVTQCAFARAQMQNENYNLGVFKKNLEAIMNQKIGAASSASSSSNRGSNSEMQLGEPVVEALRLAMQHM